MRFAEYLDKRLIFLGLNYNSKEETIKYMTEELCNYYKLAYEKEVFNDVIQRETAKSTGLGNGLAIPHGRTELADRLYIAFARSDKGVKWESIDNKPVHYIFFIVGPARLEKEYLEALGDICRIMIRHDVREGIHFAKEPEEVIKIIRESGVRHEKRNRE